MAEKLGTKDFINIGIFTTLYFIVYFACGLLSFIPILYAVNPFIYPIVTGIPFMLYITRVKKFGMITISGLLIGLLMFATGNSWLPIITSTLCAFIADLIFKAGKYQHFKQIVLGYSIFSMWGIGAMLPMWIMRDSYFVTLEASMGKEYVQTMMSYTGTWMLVALVVMALVAGIIGAFLGRSVLKKHFQRAGIV